MLKTNIFNLRDADALDILIRSALIAAAEKLIVPMDSKRKLLKRIKGEMQK